jgi:predicted transcriptional regulator
MPLLVLHVGLHRSLDFLSVILMTAINIRNTTEMGYGVGPQPPGTYSRRKAALLEHPVRVLIYRRIWEEPGTHFTALMETLDLKNGVVSHHITRLKRGGLIISRRDGVFTRYYPVEMGSQAPKGLHDKIFDVVLFHPGINQSEIGRIIDRTRQVVNYNVKKMASKGLLKVVRQGRNMNCYVRDCLV